MLLLLLLHVINAAPRTGSIVAVGDPKLWASTRIEVRSGARNWVAWVNLKPSDGCSVRKGDKLEFVDPPDSTALAMEFIVKRTGTICATPIVSVWTVKGINPARRTPAALIKELPAVGKWPETVQGEILFSEIVVADESGRLRSLHVFPTRSAIFNGHHHSNSCTVAVGETLALPRFQERLLTNDPPATGFATREIDGSSCDLVPDPSAYLRTEAEDLEKATKSKN